MNLSAFTIEFLLSKCAIEALIPYLFMYFVSNSLKHFLDCCFFISETRRVVARMVVLLSSCNITANELRTFLQFFKDPNAPVVSNRILSVCFYMFDIYGICLLCGVGSSSLRD